ncbi:MAG TPA: hypothetical protein VK849_04540 [Longimicrobiales bacterium]|nr:hypothetical protein [Longimicrobiales bacterium]
MKELPGRDPEVQGAIERREPGVPREGVERRDGLVRESRNTATNPTVVMAVAVAPVSTAPSIATPIRRGTSAIPVAARIHAPRAL